MSFFHFKFLSFVSFVFFCFGNVNADCIDLTGRYLCSNGQTIEFSQSTDHLGVITYNRKIFRTTHRWTANATADSNGWRAVCNLDRMRLYHLVDNYVLDYNLEHSGSTLIQTINNTDTDVTSFDDINALDAGDFNTALWATRTMHCQNLGDDAEPVSGIIH